MSDLLQKNANAFSIITTNPLEQQEQQINQQNQMNLINTQVQDQLIIDDSRQASRQKQKARQVSDDDRNIAASMGRQIDEFLKSMARDTASAARYHKVRTAIKAYFENKNDNTLLAVRESAANYLMERKQKSYPHRKANCEELIGMIDSYADKKGLVITAHDPSYLIDAAKLSDEQIDMEIVLAQKYTRGANENVSVSSDRRKAFTRKMKDTKLVKELRSDMNLENDIRSQAVLREIDRVGGQLDQLNPGYQTALSKVLTAYGALHQTSDEKLKNMLRRLAVDERQDGIDKIIGSEGKHYAKIHQIETILCEMMNWNIDEFSYSKPEEFLSRGTQNDREHFKTLYHKLEVAEQAGALINELRRMAQNPELESNLSEDMLREMETQIAAYQEIKKDYDTRMELMSSPYYALLLEEDVKNIDAISRSDVSIPEMEDKKKELPEGFSSYLISVKNRQQRQNGDLTFTRKKSAKKLLSSFRKANRIVGNHRPDVYKVRMENLSKWIRYEEKTYGIERVEDIIPKKQTIEIRDIKVGDEEIIPQEKNEEIKSKKEPEVIIEKEKPELKPSENLKKQIADKIEENKKEASQLQKEEAERAEKERQLEKERQIELEENRIEAQRQADQDKIRSLRDMAAVWFSNHKEEDSKEHADRAFINELLSDYENLADADATIEAARNVNERMKVFLKNLSGADEKAVEFIPTEKLAGFVGYALAHYGEKDLKKELFDQITALDDHYANMQDDAEVLAAIDEIEKKGEGISVQDQLRLYDYCALLICMNRNSEDGNDENDVRYGDFVAINGVELTRYARETSRYRQTEPESDNDDAFDNMEIKDNLLHRHICKEILSKYTKRDREFFDVLPTGLLSQLTYDVHDIAHPKLQKEAIELAVKTAEEAEEKYSELVVAAATYDRAEMAQAIAKISGQPEDDLLELTSNELLGLANDIYENHYKDSAAQIAVTTVKNIKELHNAKYYTAKMDEYYNKVLKLRHKYPLADVGERELIALKEYAIRHLKGFEEFKDLSDEDFAKLDGDGVYSLVRNIELLRDFGKEFGGEPEDPYDKNDWIKAQQSIVGLGLSEKGLNAVKQRLGKAADLDHIPKPVKIKDAVKSQFADMKYSEYHDPVAVIEEDEVKIEHPLIYRDEWKEALAHKEETQKAAREARAVREKESKKEMDRLSKEAAKRKQRNQVSVVKKDLSFTKESRQTLNLLADAGMFDGDAGMMKKHLSDNAAFLSELLGRNKDKERTFDVVFKELTNGMAQGQKDSMTLFEQSFKGIIDALEQELPGQQATAENIRELLKTKKLDDKIRAFSGQVDSILESFEKDMVSVMNTATADVFGYGRDNSMDEHLRDLAEWDRLIDEGKRELEKKNAKTSREKDKLNEKTEYQKQQDRLELEQQQNKIQFDKERGQGRFIQLLISGYYQNASKADRRRMLSYVLKDLKKDDADKKDVEKGCEFFASTLKGAGPLMQKLMQGVPERMVMSELSGALNTVKSSLSPIDAAYRERVFDEMVNDSNGAIKEIKEKKSLGAASVAETFACTLVKKNGNEERVVVKILRPDAVENMRSEEDFIRRAAMYADMTDEEVKDYEKKNGRKNIPHPIKVTESGFMAQYSEIKKEFDLTNEAMNCEKGVSNYEGKKETEKFKYVHSVHINQSIKPKKHYMVMNLAEGQTVDKVTLAGVEVRKIAQSTFKNTTSGTNAQYVLNSENASEFWKQRATVRNFLSATVDTSVLVASLAKAWVTQALYGSSVIFKGMNFHHGDLHSGNIMVDLENEKVTVLDYGNATELHDDKVNQILSMISSVMLNRADYFVTAFDKMLKLAADDEKKSKEKVGYRQLTEEQKKAFTDRLKTLLALGTAEDSGKKILVALNVAQELGIKLPKEIQNFSQCEQRLENSLLEVNETAKGLLQMLQAMDSMPVAEEELDSFSPLVRLHQKLLKTPEYEKRDVIKTAAADYQFKDAVVAMTAVYRVQSKEEADQYLKKMIAPYAALKGKINLKEWQANTKKWRKLYYEVYRNAQAGKEMSDDDKQKMYEIKSDLIEVLVNHKDVFSMVSDRDYLLLDHSKINMDSNEGMEPAHFENIMAIVEKVIPTILEAGEMVEKLGNIKTLPPNEQGALLTDVTLSVRKLYETINASQPPAVEISLALRQNGNEPKEDCERRFGGMLKKLLKNKYDDYRKAQVEYEELQKSGDKQAIEQAAKNMEEKERIFLDMFMKKAADDFSDASKYFKESGGAAQAVEDLSDFVEVMAEVVDTYMIRTFGKLNKGLAAEAKSQQDKKKEAEKQYEREEKEALKKEEAAKKEAAKKEAAKKKDAKKKGKKK